MSETKKHRVKKWEVSFAELITEHGIKFKVTKRLPELSVVETKMFKSKKKAVAQFEDWLK
ncbi:MAG TPA: hypothetical protein VI934_00770 [Candidatus Nanoarchaeia archaeon]|nr:hypothetical protein [Candidatus Nanoarchaeia archaeon]